MAKDNEIMQAAKQVCEEKNISLESVIETIEAALAVAYRKDFGEGNQNIKVDFDLAVAQAKVFDEKTVTTDEKAELTEKLKEERKAKAEEEMVAKDGAAPELKSAPIKEKKEETIDKESEEEKIDRFNPKTEITLTEAKKIKKSAKVDDVIRTELIPPAAYGRMAAQTAKQVIIQRLREAERETVYKEFKDKEGEIINGTIQRIEGRMVLIDLGPTTALLPPSEQVPREKYNSNQRYKFYVMAVNTTPKGPEIILSRSHVDMVKKLFFLEVPEVGNGSVEIKSIAREAGSRTKIAVTSTQKNIDPVGSCVGQRGSRVQTIISEIGGEKIDIIEWDEDPEKFITNSLSPAKVIRVTTNEEQKTAQVEVKEDQLSLAIGKDGQNVRLSAKLSGWKIDIVSEQGEKIIPGKKGKAEDTKEESEEKTDEVKEAKTEEKKDPSATSASSGTSSSSGSVEKKEDEPEESKNDDEKKEKKSAKADKKDDAKEELKPAKEEDSKDSKIEDKE